MRSSAYDEGYEAGYYRHGNYENPYDSDSDEYHDWEDGFVDGIDAHNYDYDYDTQGGGEWST